MSTTRSRKIKFINDGGPKAFETLMLEAFRQYGTAWLTDEQIDDMVHDQIDNWKRAQRVRHQNRRLRSTG
jgi:hypothetical protein